MVSAGWLITGLDCTVFSGNTLCSRHASFDPRECIVKMGTIELLKDRPRLFKGWITLHISTGYITIQWIYHYPVDSLVCFANTCPLDSDLSSG